MSDTARVPSAMGSRQLKLKSFKDAIGSILTACPKEDFYKAFAGFTIAEQERLYRLFTQVILSVHESIKNEFETLCHESQVGNMLDTVEELVEEQSLDRLASQKTNVSIVKQELSAIKKNEIRILKEMLEKAEYQKQQIKARIELLRKSTRDA